MNDTLTTDAVDALEEIAAAFKADAELAEKLADAKETVKSLKASLEEHRTRTLAIIRDLTDPERMSLFKRGME